MKKKCLYFMLTAGMLTSGLAANTFASDSNEEFTQFAEETESTEGMTAESVDSDLDFVDAGEAKETEESGDIFSDTEDFTTGTEISDADSSGEMQESEQEVLLYLQQSRLQQLHLQQSQSQQQCQHRLQR